MTGVLLLGEGDFSARVAVGVAIGVLFASVLVFVAFIVLVVAVKLPQAVTNNKQLKQSGKNQRR